MSVCVCVCERDVRESGVSVNGTEQERNESSSQLIDKNAMNIVYLQIGSEH